MAASIPLHFVPAACLVSWRSATVSRAKAKPVSTFSIHTYLYASGLILVSAIPLIFMSFCQIVFVDKSTQTL